MGAAAASASVIGSTPSDQEVPLSQLHTPLAAGGHRLYGSPAVAGPMKTDRNGRPLFPPVWGPPYLANPQIADTIEESEQLER